MLGAIAGDVIGSIYERHPIKSKDFPLFREGSRFTDDTVLTVAIAQAILSDSSYEDMLIAFTRKYPHAGYGGHFWRWAQNERQEPYYSWGNGSAMRASPIGFAFETAEEVLEEACKSAAITHNHPEGIKGAQAAALAIYLARKRYSKEEICEKIQAHFGYDLKRPIDQIRPDYQFDVSCQGSVPEALISFLQAKDFEDALRNAISLGGDSDTLACIAGGVAAAYYGGVPDTIAGQVRARLPAEFLDVIDSFNHRFKG